MQAFLDQLKQTFTDKDPSQWASIVEDLLRKYQQSGDTEWKKYEHWNPQTYARNLIEINPVFECLLVCWGEGQVSPIHSHMGSNCWVAILDGELKESTFTYTDSKMTLVKSSVHKTGAAAWVDIQFHEVQAETKTAISLHVYSKPIPRAKVFNPTTGQIEIRDSGFYTVKGEKSEGSERYWKDVYAILNKEKQATSH